ncbi:MAG TPA: fused MFS/spermidine synthase [Alphaproteobacteria bacterium]|nr:fused MFS/spermidine synthase [Alphaproteobacteria bacterium]USO05838.1 MAG: fused MFS/spermidine synthase [Rhodospirillales bacterium]HOO81929.1 fused MFS/spermidine synthase [Alphaproteobacteria bacterium]
MISRKGTFALFTLIILEGYVVLSSELIAIRLNLPFVGSGTDTISIIIAAILMPLAFGYHAGGRFKPGNHIIFPGFKNHINIREKLIINLLTALIFLLFALSYSFIDLFFNTIYETGFKNRIIATTLYAMLFLVMPVYLLGQTIPLSCNFFKQKKLAKITGKILFCSTLGSFAGAIFSTLVLMSHIGVHNTAIINFFILGLLITLLSRERMSLRIALTWTLILAGVMTNSSQAMRREHSIVENNQYNTISIIQDHNERHLVLNGNMSSMYSDDHRKYKYVQFIEQIALGPIWNETDNPKDILVIGAGAFTLGYGDKGNHYEYVDIDKSLKDIAEKFILKQPLQNNQTFHPLPARAFLTQTNKKYDVIILDAYQGIASIPEHLITREFFAEIKDHLKDDGKMLGNFAVIPNFKSAFSRNLDNTIRSVFPHVSRHSIHDYYALWQEEDSTITNMIYIYSNNPDTDTKTIYSDLKNRSFLDDPGETD